jgi:hypothetical protein
MTNGQKGGGPGSCQYYCSNDKERHVHVPIVSLLVSNSLLSLVSTISRDTACWWTEFFGTQSLGGVVPQDIDYGILTG